MKSTAAFIHLSRADLLCSRMWTGRTIRGRDIDISVLIDFEEAAIYFATRLFGSMLSAPTITIRDDVGISI